TRTRFDEVREAPRQLALDWVSRFLALFKMVSAGSKSHIREKGTCAVLDVITEKEADIATILPVTVRHVFTDVVDKLRQGIDAPPIDIHSARRFETVPEARQSFYDMLRID